MEETRYEVCKCHPDDLIQIPNQNVRVRYGACARNCV
jgi:hypothetical protein